MTFEGGSMKKTSLIATAALAGAALIGGGRAWAQEPAPHQATPAASAQAPSDDDDIKLFRKDIRSLKKQIIAANMDLSDNEAQQFWPIYDRYTAELATVYDKKYALLKEYAANYTGMTGEQADSYIKGRADVEESIMQLRLKYLPIFRKVLSGTSTAFFFQLDWRLGLVMDLQLASETPLIEP
jgi:hypothetical protein